MRAVASLIVSSVLSDITNDSGIRILTTLSEKGSLSVDDVEKARSRNTKHSATEIQSAVCGTLTAKPAIFFLRFDGAGYILEKK